MQLRISLCLLNVGLGDMGIIYMHHNVSGIFLLYPKHKLALFNMVYRMKILKKRFGQIL